MKRLSVIAISFIVFFSVSLSITSTCYCDTTREKYKRIQKEIKEHKKKLLKAKKQETSILTDLERINRRLNIVESKLRRYRRELKETEINIAKIEAEISEIKKTIEKYREWITRKLRVLYKYGNTPHMVMLFLSSDDIAKLMRGSRALQYITVYENRIMNVLKENLNELHAKEKELMRLRTILIKQKKKVRAEEEKLEENKKKKETILVSVRRERASYTRMLNELKSASARLLKIIREAEEKEKFVAKGFSKLKGKLPWPINGRVAIPYGSQRDPNFHTPIFRSGAYIQSKDDLYAKAVYNGKVVFAEWFKGYGKLVIINHGEGYHTLYGSLSEIFTKVGDIIKVKQVIGRVGSSSVLNAPGLYFELRYKGKPLNPLQWLKKK